MFEPVKKTFRRLRREYPRTTLFGATGAIVGAGFGAVIVAGTGGAAAIILIPAAAAGATGAAMGRIDDATFVGETMRLNGMRLVGEKKHLRAIYKTQQLIDLYAKKYRHKPELPEKVLRRIAPHLQDLQASLQQVRVFHDTRNNQEPAAVFAFTRPFYDESGKLSAQPVVLAEVAPARRPQPQPENPPQLPAAGNLSKQFPAPANDDAAREMLLQEIKKLQGRIEQLEKPPGTQLPKKPFRKD